MANPLQGAGFHLQRRVRVGTSPYCPTCYADCGKRATSDNMGTFAIERLDSTLVFRVFVIAKGYEPQFVKADPLDGKTISVALKSRAANPDDTRRIVAGQVIGPHGGPWPVPWSNRSGVNRASVAGWEACRESIRWP